MQIPLKVNGKESSCEYNYLTDCTDSHINVTYELDQLKDKELDIVDLYKIALWKTERYIIVPDDVLAAINAIKCFRTSDIKYAKWESETKKVLNLLLDKNKVRGANIAMASTFLRFSNPSAYQIIDERAYRSVYKKSNFPKNGRKAVAIYIDYMRRLYETFKKTIKGVKIINFEDMDRYLYAKDIDEGNNLVR